MIRNNEQVRNDMFDHIDQWKNSNQSQKSYCIEHGIAYHVFHYYFKRYREVHSVGKESKPPFVKLQLDQPEVMAHAELILPDGKRLVFHQPVSSAFLKALIS